MAWRMASPMRRRRPTPRLYTLVCVCPVLFPFPSFLFLDGPRAQTDNRMRAYIAPGVLNMIIWHFHIGTHRHTHTRAYYKDSIVLDPLTNAKAEMSKPASIFPYRTPPCNDGPTHAAGHSFKKSKERRFALLAGVCLSPLSRMTFRPPLYTYTHVEMDRRLHLAASATTGGQHAPFPEDPDRLPPI